VGTRLPRDIAENELSLRDSANFGRGRTPTRAGEGAGGGDAGVGGAGREGREGGRGRGGGGKGDGWVDGGINVSPNLSPLLTPSQGTLGKGKPRSTTLTPQGSLTAILDTEFSETNAYVGVHEAEDAEEFLSVISDELFLRKIFFLYPSKEPGLDFRG
jgi:hypothetical protein